MSAHEHITHLGGANWKWTREQVIQSIDAKTNTFYVMDAATGKRSNVGVVRPTDGRSAFLQTYADGDWDAERNTREFISALPSYRAHGLLAVCLNLSGGSPQGYSWNQPWQICGFTGAARTSSTITERDG